MSDIDSSEKSTKPIPLFLRPVAWLGEFLLTIGQGLVVALLALKVSWQTKRGRVRWTLLFVVLLTLASGVYGYPQGYNQAARVINEKLDGLENASVPNWADGVRSFAALSVPEVTEREFNLGLDLVGGTQLLYVADTAKIPEEEREAALEGVRDVIERRVNAFGIAEPLVQTDRSGDEWRVLVELAGVVDVEAAIAQIGETPLLEFQEQDPTAEQPELTPEQQQLIEDSDAAAREAALGIIAQLNNGEDFAALVSEFSEDPGSVDSGGELGYTVRGVFVPEFEAALFDDLATGELTSEPIKTAFGYHVIEKLDERTNDDAAIEVNGRHILLRTLTAQDVLPHDADFGWKNTELSGKYLDRAQVVFDQQTNVPQVQLEFNDEGAALFEEITTRNINQPIGIFLDGELLSAPNVSQAIVGGTAQIVGNFTIESARLLVQRLNAGALPVPITLVGQQTVGASLGQQSVTQSLNAALIGFALVALFMVVYYRLPGLLSVLALGVYAAITLAIFKLFGVTLTLAGVTGFILSIGMAVDANILIFERLREELRAGRPFSNAVEVGFTRAWASIRDSNVSSLITCAILYWFGTSVVRGFALTLGIGIVISMFSAVTVSRTLLRLVVGEREAVRRPWLYGVRGLKTKNEQPTV